MPYCRATVVQARSITSRDWISTPSISKQTAVKVRCVMSWASHLLMSNKGQQCSDQGKQRHHVIRPLRLRLVQIAGERRRQSHGQRDGQGVINALGEDLNVFGCL